MAWHVPDSTQSAEEKNGRIEKMFLNRQANVIKKSLFDEQLKQLHV